MGPFYPRLARFPNAGGARRLSLPFAAMSTRRTVSIIVGALVLIFLLVLMTAGVPKGCEPSPDKAPSPN